MNNLSKKTTAVDNIDVVQKISTGLTGLYGMV